MTEGLGRNDDRVLNLVLKRNLKQEDEEGRFPCSISPITPYVGFGLVSQPPGLCDTHHSVWTSSNLQSTKRHEYRLPFNARRQSPHEAQTAIPQSNDPGTEGGCPSQCGGPAGARHLQSIGVEAAGARGRSARAIA